MDHGGAMARFKAACAYYWQLTGSWPTQARMDGHQLHALLDRMNDGEADHLIQHIELRSRRRSGMSVGGVRVVEYGELDHSDVEPPNLLRAGCWLEMATSSGATSYYRLADGGAIARHRDGWHRQTWRPSQQEWVDHDVDYATEAYEISAEEALEAIVAHHAR